MHSRRWAEIEATPLGPCLTHRFGTCSTRQGVCSPASALLGEEHRASSSGLLVAVLVAHVHAGLLGLLLQDAAKLVVADASHESRHFGYLDHPLASKEETGTLKSTVPVY